MKMASEKKIIVTGHKNPDTDSIVSAIAYAELKKLQGMDNCFPVRAGKLNPQTEYVLSRFGFREPEFISDLVPKVRNYMSPDPLTLYRGKSLWSALEIFNSSHYKMLPVVDENGRYLSVLHYNAFAMNMLKKVNPRKRPVIPTSLRLLAETISGTLFSGGNPDEIRDRQIVVAASDLQSLEKVSSLLPMEGCIIMAGNRKDIQDYVIDRGFSCLIVTGGHSITAEQEKRAARGNVSVILSPYDTVTTSALALYSSPVEYMGDASVPPLQADQYLRDVSKLINSSVSRALPVADEDQKVIGILSQGDLMREPNMEVIMVDHNEKSQAVDGIENYRILEIIDHHRLGNLYTEYPITFINRPVGSTATVVSEIYTQNGIVPSKAVASILLCGILSDTLLLRSATVTDNDKLAADALAGIAGLDINALGMDLMTAGSAAAGRPADEIINMDLKQYDYKGRSYTVSQIEVTSSSDISRRSDEILAALSRKCEEGRFLFSAVMVTDITMLNSALFICGESSIIKGISYPSLGKNIFFMKGAVSRKKQLLPYLSDLIKQTV